MIDSPVSFPASALTEKFGCRVFGDDAMRARLPKDIYKSLHRTVEDGRELDITVASVVANAMKDWAIEQGATHFTHWFQPMTGITAEKHDGFISPAEGGRAIMEFSGKELIRGEPDASSFPSGGLRATFEARGYTAWDPSSYAFIKDDSLCIPTAFCSFSGEVLDKKTPLLRSMEAISAPAARICRLFGYSDVTRVVPTAGAEQEYFLVDAELFKKRPDLALCGVTLFGARPPKGQETQDHYYGAIRPRVIEYMKELNRELWALGIYAKTEHNEVAPAQHELAPVFGTVNVATDHNQLTMEMMKKVAERHGMACLLAEKPFAGVNGSGKHNNWSLMTNTGINLFDPGPEPESNKLFLIFVAAVLKAVDEYSDLLRISAATAGNDRRLGGGEAPPCVISVFLGEQITSILECLASGRPYIGGAPVSVNQGAAVLPGLSRDTSDRNRTSPFAFTGNKFEFRMPGSSSSIAGPNTILNTIVADALCSFADRLEASSDAEAEFTAIIRDVMNEHGRIIFNGNNYGREWEEEAKRRGLPDLRSTPDALPYLIAEKNVALFARHKIYNERELRSRYEILVDNYVKVTSIEALTMADMANQIIIPSAVRFVSETCSAASARKAAGLSGEGDGTLNLARRAVALQDAVCEKTAALERAIQGAKIFSDPLEAARYCRSGLLPAMEALRAAADELELILPAALRGMPTCAELMYSI